MHYHMGQGRKPRYPNYNLTSKVGSTNRIRDPFRQEGKSIVGAVMTPGTPPPDVRSKNHRILSLTSYRPPTRTRRVAKKPPQLQAGVDDPSTIAPLDGDLMMTCDLDLERAKKPPRQGRYSILD